MNNLYLIVAYVVATRAIGLNEKLLWENLKYDMRNFVALTKGNVMIVGRTTYKTFPKQLPNRDIIIVTRNRDYYPSNVTDPSRIHICHSVEESYELALSIAGERKIFVIGGEEIYTEFLYSLTIPLYEIIATEVDAGNLQGDRHFPLLPENWNEVSSMHYEKDDENDYDFVIRTYRSNVA